MSEYTYRLHEELFTGPGEYRFETDDGDKIVIAVDKKREFKFSPSNKKIPLYPFAERI